MGMDIPEARDYESPFCVKHFIAFPLMGEMAILHIKVPFLESSVAVYLAVLN